MTNIDVLLDFIAKPESGGNLDVVYGGIKPADRPARPLTQMTIGEVLAWQKRIDSKYRSEAAGKFQIMEDTLRGLYREAGLTESDLFDAKGQRALAVALLKRRGLDKYLAGAMTTQDFANNLAKEWASLPVVSGPKAGRSYYAGDGLNKSHVSVEAFLAAVAGVKATTPKGAGVLKDRRSQIVAGVAIISAIAAYLVGDSDLATTVQAVVTAISGSGG